MVVNKESNSPVRLRQLLMVRRMQKSQQLITVQDGRMQKSQQLITVQQILMVQQLLMVGRINQRRLMAGKQHPEAMVEKL